MRCTGLLQTFAPLLAAGMLLWGCADSDEPTALSGDVPGSEARDSGTSPGEEGQPQDEEGGLDPVIPEPAFSLADVVPGRGVTGGGDTVTLVGAGFEDGMQVIFGTVLANPPFVASPSVAGVTVPAGTAGVVDVTINHPDGRTSTLEDAFRYYEPFGLDSISPSSGPLAGGTPVVVEGFGLDGDGVVLIGGRTLVDARFTSPTRVEGFAPPGDVAGPAVVSVVTAAGKADLDTPFTYIAALRVHSVSPFTGPVEGGNTATIRGTGFNEGTIFQVGGAVAAVQTIEGAGTQAKVTVPPGTKGLAAVAARNGVEQSILADAYYYSVAADLQGETKLFALFPKQGSTEGNTLVSLVAAGLTSFADTSVSFGGVPATLSALDPDSGLIVALTPPGEVGAVDVTVSTKNGSATLAGAFTYQAEPTIKTVEPAKGPAAGGTEVVLEGRGFAGATAVRVGALYAPSFEVQSDKRLTLVTPAGSAGYADIVIERAGEPIVGENRFTYEAGELRVLAVVPDTGAIAGGNAVRVYGTDFSSKARVYFDDQEIVSREVLSPTEISIITPKWLSPAAVDVTVEHHAIANTADTLEGGFTYFNPAATAGGTWGSEVQGTVNVSVLDMWTQQGIEDAFVILWTDENTPYKGYTDFLGGITFTGPDLQGEQMVSAWAPGYSASSIVEFDAPATIKGRAIYNEKYLMPPPGTCGGTFSDPIEGTIITPEDYVCKPCTTAEECGPADLGNECTLMFDGKTFCTPPCASGEECPSGYACMAVTLGETKRCMPVSGVIRIDCQLAAGSAFQTPPGGVVQAELITGDFEISAPAGQWAVVCQANQWDPADGTSTPLVMGAAYPVVTESGKETDLVEVPLDVAFKRQLTLAMDYPPSRLSSLPQHRARVLISFGALGVHEVLRAEIEPDLGGITLPRMPEGLTGSLAGASWLVLGGAYSAESTWYQWFAPYSTAILRDLPGLAESHLYRANNQNELELENIPITPLRAIYSDGEGAFIAVGDAGGAYLRTAAGWQPMGSPIEANWRGVAGRSINDAWMVGEEGRLARWNGAVWTLVQTLPFEPWAIAVSAEGQALVVGDGGSALFSDGDAWEPVDLGTAESLRAVWAEPQTGAFWVAGNNGTLLRWDGVNAQVFPQPDQADLYAVSGNAAGQVLVGGQFGVLRRKTGSTFAKVETGQTRNVYGLWVAESGATYVVGERGLYLEIAPNGLVVDRSLDQAGTAFRAASGVGDSLEFVVGQDSVLVGPLYEVPEFLPPLSNGQITDDAFSWTGKGGAVPDFNYVVIGEPWWRPIWQVVTDGPVEDVVLPDLEALVGTDQLQGMEISLEITRGKLPGFDISNFEYINMYFKEQLWSAWSVNSTTFTSF